MINMGEQARKKALVIGLDGVAFSLLNKFLSNGYLPELQSVIRSGYKLEKMDVSIPEVSSVSWTTFATGVNPAEHNIYGFMDLKLNTYNLYFPNSMNVKAPAFWEILGKTYNTKKSSLHNNYKNKRYNNFRSVILNMPQTYPAYPLNGVIVSGFVALNLQKAVYPESAFNYLSDMGYILDVDIEKVKNDKKLFFEELFNVYDKRETVFFNFFEKYDWDLFFCVVTETDRLHHYFYDAVEDEGNNYHPEIIKFYKKVDLFIKNIFQKFMKVTDGKGFFMMMSDHGFTTIKSEVYVNQFLQKEGFLKLNDVGEFYNRISADSTAFAMDPARIYINTENKYPKGKIKPEDKQKIIEEVKKMFLNLKDDKGNAIVKKIFSSDDLYSGPYKNLAPDLVCVSNYGFDLKSNLQKTKIFDRSLLTGMHTQDDAFCILPEVIKINENINIVNLADLILQYFI